MIFFIVILVVIFLNLACDICPPEAEPKGGKLNSFIFSRPSGHPVSAVVKSLTRAHIIKYSNTTIVDFFVVVACSDFPHETLCPTLM